MKKPEKHVKVNPIQERQAAKLAKLKPVMSIALEAQVTAAVAQFTNRHLWKEWGLADLRKQGACVLLHGPPGTGKTRIAEYIGYLVGNPITTLDLSNFGSDQPGENERNIGAFFADGRRQKKTIFLDECDSILWKRDEAGTGTIAWMIPIINKLLTEIGNYEYLVLLATNRKAVLDPALERRIIADVEVTRPHFEERKVLWRTKIPLEFPLQLSAVQIESLASYDLTGATIENTIIQASQVAMLQGELPSFENLKKFAEANIPK